MADNDNNWGPNGSILHPDLEEVMHHYFAGTEPARKTAGGGVMGSGRGGAVPRNNSDVAPDPNASTMLGGGSDEGGDPGNRLP